MIVLTLSVLSSTSRLCPSWNIVDIECKYWASSIGKGSSSKMLRNYTESGDVVTCKPSFGLLCYNNKQPSGLCQDYSVRFRCRCSSSSAPPPPPPSKVTSAAVRDDKCPAGKMWTSCAYRCDQVSQLFFLFFFYLKKKGFDV